MSKEKKENISDEKKERKENYMSRRNEIMDEINREEKMKVRFTNNEFPSAPADFVYRGSDTTSNRARNTRSPIR